jgi:hypothetical protein
MNHKTLISFLLFMIVLVIAYFAIITVKQSSTQGSYGVTVLTPSVSYENFKPFRSKNTNRKNQYPQVRNNMQPSLSQGSMLSSTSRNVKNGSIPAVGERNYAYGQSSYNRHATPAASSTARSGGVSTLSGGTAGMTTFRATTRSSSSGTISSKDSRPYAVSPEEPFSGSISPGLPDPGGNSDDSCEDDIVFLPVPDGLWYMIFLSFIYALIKIFRGRLKEKKVLKQITSI